MYAANKNCNNYIMLYIQISSFKAIWAFKMLISLLINVEWLKLVDVTVMTFKSVFIENFCIL